MRLVLVMPLKSFDDFQRDVLCWVYLTERIAHLVAMDYLRIMWDTLWGPYGS